MIVSPDRFLVNDEGQYEWSPRRCEAAWEKADRLLRQVIPGASALMLMVGVPASGKSTWLEIGLNRFPYTVYFDATLTKRKTRAKYITIAKAHRKHVHAVVMLTDFRTCVTRNAAREPSRRVPWQTMNIHLEQLRAEPVLAEEGFNHVHVIRG